MDDERFDRLTKFLATGLTRRRILRGGIGGLASVLGLAGRSVVAGAAKQSLCHATGDPAHPWVIITVSEPAVAAHVAHGDTLYGGCCADADCGSATPFCEGGACVACRTDPDCPAAGVCHRAFCADGVCGTLIAAGAPCDDGDPCTENDVCDAEGRCHGSPRVCPDPADPCLEGVCDPVTGTCVSAPRPDGAACQDPCFPCGGTCQNGSCISGGCTSICGTGGGGGGGDT